MTEEMNNVIMEAYILDEYLDQGRGEEVLGARIEHDVFGTGHVKKIRRKERDDYLYAVEWITECPNDDCNNYFTFMTMSGCHKGAFCYVVNEYGIYQCDLRNSYLTCGIGDCQRMPPAVIKVQEGIGKNIGVNI